MQFGQGVNPARVKAANQAAILKTIYHRGPIKRAEIAESLGLTLPTITTNIHSMMARGIVREAGPCNPAPALRAAGPTRWTSYRNPGTS